MGYQAIFSGDSSVILVDQKELIGLQPEAFNKLVQESIDKLSKIISVDLSKVQFISSLGIGLLVHAYTTCMKRNIKFNLQGVNDRIMKVLNQVKLGEIFNFI
jgi:anti-anti-sigma factor